MSSRWTLCALLLGISFLQGCLSPKQVAGREHPVTLISCQTAVPYLVILEQWKAEQQRRLETGQDASDAALMADDGFLAPHRVQGGHVTPAQVGYPGYPYIAVFKREGYEPLMFGPFTPPRRVEVCFPGCEARLTEAAAMRAPENRASR